MPTMNDAMLEYEYAVVRFVPSVEREEFINVGLVMMCKRRRWIRVRTGVNPARLDAFASGVDPMTLDAQLRGFERVARGEGAGGPIATLEPHERFRWLTAVRSSCLSTSRPHPGLCTDPDQTFDRLYDSLVR